MTSAKRVIPRPLVRDAFVRRDTTTTAEPALSGDRCRCPNCREYFNSTAAFDMHRRGAHGLNRHCLSADEMRRRGMRKNSKEFWMTPARRS